MNNNFLLFNNINLSLVINDFVWSYWLKTSRVLICKFKKIKDIGKYYENIKNDRIHQEYSFEFKYMNCN